MRRQLAGLGNERLAEIAAHFEGRDARRDSSFIRRDLESILRYEQDAAPVRRQQVLTDALRDKNTDRAELPELRRRLRENRSSVNEQRNPLRWGSVARQRFGDLYRR